MAVDRCREDSPSPRPSWARCPRSRSGRCRTPGRVHVPTHRAGRRGVCGGSRAVPHRGLRAVDEVPVRLQAALHGVEVRACFLGHGTFSAIDLASYCGPKPQGETEASLAELTAAAAWIRRWSDQLRRDCGEAGLPYVDVGDVGFEAAMRQAQRQLVRRVAGSE
jgi:hypothetical protein